ncbi:MAG: sulfatase-like hydrolase/transferase [Chloroflexi bacterium]|nr:sulfatase-like hydrolase/transferase [Chloroflexota bacterium]
MSKLLLSLRYWRRFAAEEIMLLRLEFLRLKLARYLPHLTILAGIGLVIVSLAVDIVGLGANEGFGAKQAKLAVIGVVIMLVGAALFPAILRPLTSPSSYHHPARNNLQGVGQVLRIGVWFGLLMGFSDLLYFADLKFVNHEVLRFGVDLIWMAPVAGIFIAGVSALLLGMVSIKWPKLGSIRAATTVLGFLGVSNLLFSLLANTHMVAVLFLSLTVAAVIARFLANHPDNYYGFVRRTSIALTAVFVALTVGFVGWTQVSEGRARAALPPAEIGSPNVLLITLDTVRARSMSLHGYERPTTPKLEQFAEGGATFEWAISTSPWTLPAHASLFTGRYPSEMSTGFAEALDDTFPTLAEVLSANGYESAGFIANHFYLSRGFGLSRGFVHYEDFDVTLRDMIRSSSLAFNLFNDKPVGRIGGGFRGLDRIDAEFLNDAFLGWLADREDPQRPFFAFLNYFDAHEPYLPPPAWALKFSGKEKPQSTWERRENLPVEEIRELNDSYDASIAYLDDQLGVLFAELERRGLLDDTLVIITSDHGEQFGEHGLMDHANSLYLPLIHVPMLVRYPDGVPSNIRISQPISIADIPSTILDLAGIEGESDFPGQSLARFWENGSDFEDRDGTLILSEVKGQDWEPEWLPVFKGDMISLVQDLRLYIRNGADREELYDLENDPLEQYDLAQDEVNQRSLKEYREVTEGLHIIVSDR